MSKTNKRQRTRKTPEFEVTSTQQVLYIYHVKNEHTSDYDFTSFTDFVAVCANEQEAREMHPAKIYTIDHESKKWVFIGADGSKHPVSENNANWIHPYETFILTVEKIGTALSHQTRGVIIASKF